MSEIMQAQTIEPPAIVTNEAAALLDVITRLASNPQIDVDRVERMMGLYERMLTRQREIAIEEAFSEAFAKAQAAMKPVIAASKNEQTKSKYADQAAIDLQIRDVYTSHGFSLTFDTVPAPTTDMIRLVARLRHTRGYFKDYHLDVPADGKGAKGGDVMTRTHATGSGLTYGQRYLTVMIFNVAVAGRRDDDGNAAGKIAAAAPIGEEQLAQLVALCDDLGVDKRQFCEYLHVPSLAEIPQRDFIKALNVLAARSAQRAAGKKEVP